MGVHPVRGRGLASMRARIRGLLTALCLVPGLECAMAQIESVSQEGSDFPVLPLPPAIEQLYGLPVPFPKGRHLYLDLLRREAERQGLPAAIADAVTQVESAYT